VLAGGDRAQVPLPVQPVRQRVVDRLDVGVVENRLVAVIGPFDAMLIGPGAGPVEVTGSDRHQPGTGGPGRGGDAEATDP
jgi:hypothetical protein